MKIKHLSILAVVLLVADQALKIWVKTSFHLGEALVVIPNWFQLLFVENIPYTNAPFLSASSTAAKVSAVSPD